MELLVAERCGLATTHLDSLTPSSEDPGMNPASFSCFALIYDDLCQPIPAPGIVAIETAVANSSRCAVPQQAPRPAEDYSCGCMFWGERGGGHTRQAVGPSVDAAIMTTVLSTNRVDSRSFSSRNCAFRRTHTSTDPIRLLCIRLALPLTLSLPSRFAPGTKLMVAVSPRAPWFAGAFSRDCTFLGCRGGVLTINRQPGRPLVSAAAITTATVINHVDSGSFSSRCCTLRRTHTSADPIRILCIRLALTLTLSRPPGFASCARLMVCVLPCALWVVGDFSCDCMFWDDWGGGLTGQPMGPQVDTANMRTVLSTNHVDSRSFSPRCWAFRRTHPSANPIRLLCIRLALPLTLSLPSGFVPSTKLVVGASLRALGLVGDFSCDCMFWDDRGGRLTGQPMGPQVDTANMRTVVVVVVDSHIQPIVLATEETTVTQQVSHRPIKCQSRLWSQRGTKVNGSHHGDNPLLRPKGSKSRQKVMRLYKQWHRPISKRFIKPPYSISRATSIDSECCRLPTTNVLSKKTEKLRKNYAPTSFDQQVQDSQGHTLYRNKKK